MLIISFKSMIITFVSFILVSIIGIVDGCRSIAAYMCQNFSIAMKSIQLNQQYLILITLLCQV